MKKGIWQIAKQFDFCYGHRVWSQSLDKDLSLNSPCACRHLHGHQGTVLVHLESDVLKNGMVTDFHHLNWFKKWLDETLDHKFIMDINDPMTNDITTPLIPSYLKKQEDGFYIFEKSLIEDKIEAEYLKEKLEGLVFVDFVPTSENLAFWMYSIIKAKFEKKELKGFSVCRVQLFETPKSQSSFFYEN